MTKIIIEEEVKEETELHKHRLYNFVRLLGDDYEKDKINDLTKSEVDYHDLENLLNKNCPKELAIEILM
jgi:hypothetical protein